MGLASGSSIPQQTNIHMSSGFSRYRPKQAILGSGIIGGTKIVEIPENSIGFDVENRSAALIWFTWDDSSIALAPYSSYTVALAQIIQANEGQIAIDGHTGEAVDGSVSPYVLFNFRIR